MVLVFSIIKLSDLQGRWGGTIKRLHECRPVSILSSYIATSPYKKYSHMHKRTIFTILKIFFVQWTIRRYQTDIIMILLDFSKAFDKVPHRRLLTIYKLTNYGTRGHLYTVTAAT